MTHAAGESEKIAPSELGAYYDASLFLVAASLRQSISLGALFHSESVLRREQVFSRLAVISYRNLLLHPMGILQTASILSFSALIMASVFVKYILAG
ncbi:hypothetical protein P4200_12955 [Pseudomonas aeruginosa]|nr:hypothetical protein [Pseudomonas aeruginosa]